MNYELRPIQPKDAQKYLAMMTQLDTETKFMMMEPGERTTDVSKVQSMIQRQLSQNSFFMVAWSGDRIVGMMTADKGQYHRIAHSAYIVVGILREYQGIGIGTAMFEALDHWAHDNQVTRLELTVVAKNQTAVHLYQKCGFEIEGTKKRSMIIDDRYEDEYYMGKLM